MADLSTGRFTILLARLDSDRTKAAEKYVGLRHKLVKIFERTQCSDPDALADETLDRLAKKLEDDEEAISSVGSFAYGVAQKISLESRRHAARFVSIHDGYENEDSLIGECDPETRIVESMQNAHDVQCLDRCLERLMPRDRELLLEYYQDEKQVRIRHRQELATKLEVNLPTLRRAVCGLREKLRACIHHCVKLNLKNASNGLRNSREERDGER